MFITAHIMQVQDVSNMLTDTEFKKLMGHLYVFYKLAEDNPRKIDDLPTQYLRLHHQFKEDPQCNNPTVCLKWTALEYV